MGIVLACEMRLKYLCAFINDTKRLDEFTEQLLEVRILVALTRSSKNLQNLKFSHADEYRAKETSDAHAHLSHRKRRKCFRYDPVEAR